METNNRVTCKKLCKLVIGVSMIILAGIFAYPILIEMISTLNSGIAGFIIAVASGSYASFVMS